MLTPETMLAGIVHNSLKKNVRCKAPTLAKANTHNQMDIKAASTGDILPDGDLFPAVKRLPSDPAR
jgi:hypothetical protein